MYKSGDFIFFLLKIASNMYNILFTKYTSYSILPKTKTVQAQVNQYFLPVQWCCTNARLCCIKYGIVSW